VIEHTGAHSSEGCFEAGAIAGADVGAGAVGFDCGVAAALLDAGAFVAGVGSLAFGVPEAGFEGSCVGARARGFFGGVLWVDDD
jgi:hypothetical protein